VCGAVIERRWTRSPNKPWPAAVPHDFVNKWTFKWPSKSDQLIDWRTIRCRAGDGIIIIMYCNGLFFFDIIIIYLSRRRVWRVPLSRYFFVIFSSLCICMNVQASKSIFHRIILIWFFFRTRETVYPTTTTTTARHRVKPKRNFSRPSRNGSAIIIRYIKHARLHS